MIFLKTSIIDLTAAYEQICAFNRALEEEWIPGFQHSYKRRQEAYIKADQRYQERSSIVRMLFKQPKPPGKLPADVQNQISDRLWQNWIESINDSPQDQILLVDQHLAYSTEHTVLSRKNEVIWDDSYFVVSNIKTRFSKAPVIAIIGPSGAWFINALESENSRQNLQPLPVQGLESPISHLPNGTGHGNCRVLDQLAVFRVIDELLAHHQTVEKLATVSAVKLANQFMNQEKDYLLKLAATL